MSKDLYSILELPRGAESNEIRKQYLKLSRQYHPDKASAQDKETAEEKFKAISNAYEILSDDQKKAFYDQTGQVPGEGSAGNSPFPGGNPFPFDMSQMFGMFGQGGRQQQRGGRRVGKAPSRKTHIPLTLKDFYYGRTLQINLERQRFCPGCKGEGCTNTRSCSDCNGQGVKRQVIQMGPMIMENTGPCGSCRGSGKIRGDSCGGCSGSKFIKQDKQLELLVKKGMKPGDSVVFHGESSHVDEFTEAGDVVVELQAADEDTCWTRDGSSLKTTRTICLGESLCGTKVHFTDHPGYPDGLVLQIPVGIQGKDTLVFVGLGMPIEDRFGDLLLTVVVKPSKIELEVLNANSPYFKGLFTLSDVELKGEVFNAQRVH